MINIITNKVVKNQTVIRSIKIGKIEETNKEVISKTLCKYFATIGMTFAKNVKPSNVPIENYLTNIKSNEKSLCPTNSSEVLTIINSLINKKSSGWDGISNLMLKELKSVLCQPLSILFNRSISTGIFPSIFKKADVILLHKSGNTNESTNYRPISLLVTMSKILEKIIYKHVYTFLDMTDQLFQSQYGFRSNHSCEHAIQELVGKILKNSENKKYTVAVFLDLLKAFDSLEHHVLLSKLEKYGI